MKGLILCAGQGTRLHPLTFTMPKCMIPVSGEPIIHSIIRKLVGIGITDIGIVMNNTQHVIRQSLGNGQELSATLTYVIQQEANGLADAVRSAASYIGSEPFLLMLGDNLIEGRLEPLIESMARHDVAASILLARVEDPRSFGVAAIANHQVVGLEEKPKEPKSDLAIVGAYAFSSSIWPAIDTLVPSARGEYELTDAIQKLIDLGHRVAYSITEEPFFDVGTHDRWLAANRYRMDGDPRAVAVPQPDASVHDVQFIAPVIIHPSAKIYHSIIGPYVYVGPGSVINRCVIVNSILTDAVKLSHVNAADSIFGSRAQFAEATLRKRPSRYIMGTLSTAKPIDSYADSN